jgi:hypothetical protein
MGSAVISKFFVRWWALPLPLRTPHCGPRSFLKKLYIWRGLYFLLFTSSLLFFCRHYFLFLALAFSSQPRALRHCMPIKRVAHRAKMAKKGTKKLALKWVPSSFDEVDLKKAKKEHSMPAAVPVVFPGDEIVPKPPAGYRVMFLAFLLHGLSLPAHEFLRGLLFVYGVQLHQLMPNSILHIACFINLCESFLGIDPHWVLCKFLFRLCPSVSLSENSELGGAIVSVRSELHYLEFKMASSVHCWRQKWFYIKDQKTADSGQYGLAPFDASKGLTKLTTWDASPSKDSKV